MTITRAQAHQHLIDEFAALATTCKQGTTDTGDGYGPALDKAFRALGVTETNLTAATATDAQAPALLALCEYHALSRFARTLAVRGEIDARQTVGPRTFQFQAVKDLLAEAKAACAALGYPVDGASGGWDYGRLQLDYIEPEPDETA